MILQLPGRESRRRREGCSSSSQQRDCGSSERRHLDNVSLSNLFFLRLFSFSDLVSTEEKLLVKYGPAVQLCGKNERKESKLKDRVKRVE
jgi:hypothetical protein